MNPLQRLVQNELSSQGIKRSKLVKLMGYRNINGGLRRLDDLLATLDEHERLLPLLNKALNIKDNRLLAASSELDEQLAAAKRAAFRPMIQVIPSRRPSPIFVAAMCPHLLNIEVPDHLSLLPTDEALSIVCDLYRKHRGKYEGWPKGKGFVYHRSYDESFEFDAACCLVSHNEQHIGMNVARLSVGGTPVQITFESNGNDVLASKGGIA